MHAGGEVVDRQPAEGVVSVCITPISTPSIQGSVGCDFQLNILPSPHATDHQQQITSHPSHQLFHTHLQSRPHTPMSDGSSPEQSQVQCWECTGLTTTNGGSVMHSSTPLIHYNLSNPFTYPPLKVSSQSTPLSSISTHPL